MENLNVFDSIIISPHLDDAILSLCGYIHKYKGKERILVLNVFSGCPDPKENLSPVAQEIIKQDLNVNDSLLIDPVLYNQRRNEEDKKAITHLGISRHNLDYLDAIFRGNPPLYTNESELFLSIKECDFTIIDQLFCFIKDNLVKDCKLFIPLAIGKHVDHQIINRLGRELVKENYNCVFYEDFPYCSNHKSSWLNDVNLDYDPFYIDLENIIDIKVNTIEMYDSQIQGLFGERTNIVNILSEYFEKTSSRTLRKFERIWVKRGKTIGF